MKVKKSSRHSKITGDFGEAAVLYWLSKYGFECALVDHTGIDIIARNPHTSEIMGISIKSRCRAEGTETDHVSIPNGEFAKARAACEAFGCVPYFAIVIDAGDAVRGFILPMKQLLALARPGKTAVAWKMTEAHVQRYAQNPEIMAFEFRTKTSRWWSGSRPATS